MTRNKSLICLISGLLIVGGFFYAKHFRDGANAPPNVRDRDQSLSVPPGQRGPANQEIVGRFRALQAQERELDQTIWADEMLAQEYEQVFIDMWDAMRHSTNQLSVLSNMSFGQLLIGAPEAPVKHEHGIEVVRFADSGRSLTSDEWKALIREQDEGGLSVVQSEWRLTRLDKEGERGATSTIAMTLHAMNSGANARYILEGDLNVSWRKRGRSASPPQIEKIDARNLTLKKRVGDPPFAKVVNRVLRSTVRSHALEPVIIVYDLDRDGLSEIILVTKNTVFRNLGNMDFEALPLVQEGFEMAFTGLVADFTGDGSPDFLAADAQGLLLWAGDDEGSFREEPGRVWSAETEPLFNVYGISAGDIDGDRDLDVWFGQYKKPYIAGQMPTPYYDANDGFPSFLLVNDGKGSFSDVTRESGIAEKRFRRSYSGSLADLDGDSDLDLVTLNDFAGIDVFLNDGEGGFTDITEEAVDERHLFGMSHSFGDYNLDGELDIFAIGMTSNFADRLDHLALGRSEFSDYQEMRSAMRYGNRLYFGGGGRFEQLPMSAAVRDAGWAWGASAFDFDNDGDHDLYVVNGHITRSTARDYDSQFWIHDIYVANSDLDPAVSMLFRSRAQKRHNEGMSHGGNHHNRLFINEAGRSFLESAFLMGVALPRDYRNVLSEDLDGDGKLDLILTVYEKWPRPRQELQVYQNTGASGGNWIGFRLDERVPASSPVGSRVEILTPSGGQFRQIVVGDSYRVQNSLNVHFGLGAEKSVTSARVLWPTGEVTNLEDPSINSWNRVSP